MMIKLIEKNIYQAQHTKLTLDDKNLVHRGSIKIMGFDKKGKSLSLKYKKSKNKRNNPLTNWHNLQYNVM